MPYFYFGYDIIGWILVIIGIVITVTADIYVNKSYSKYKKIKTKKELTGCEVARKILDANGLSDVYVVETTGILSDHYDPRRKTIRLSKDIFHGTTIAANAVAAHEVGHALQYKDGYTPIKIRNAILPLANFGSKAGYIIILISLFAGITDLLWFGIILIGFMLLFQLITLPVEFNASKRAKIQLKKDKFLNDGELNGASTMLSAAAMTYVASVLTAILEILRLVLIARNND